MTRSSAATPAKGRVTAASRGRSRARPTPRPAASVAWLLGKDQSPGGGHSATAATPRSRTRQGRSSSTTSFTASLAAYASTVPTPASTAPAETRVSARRTALHQTHASSSPRATSVPSQAASSSGPAQEGASATESVTERYADAETPSVTSTACSVPRPPGARPATAAAPAPRTAQASRGRAVRGPLLLSLLMGAEPRRGEGRSPGPNGTGEPRRRSGAGLARTPSYLTYRQF